MTHGSPTADVLVVGGVFLGRWWAVEPAMPIAATGGHGSVCVSGVSDPEQVTGLGAGVARLLQALGMKTHLVCALGRDPEGERARQVLEADHVDCRPVFVADKTGLRWAIRDASGTRLAVVENGANLLLPPDTVLNVLEHFSGVVVASLDVAGRTVEALLNQVDPVRHRLYLVGGPAALRDYRLLGRARAVLLDLAILSRWYGRPVESRPAFVQALEVLDRLGAPTTYIGFSSRGAVIRPGNGGTAAAHWVAGFRPGAPPGPPDLSAFTAGVIAALEAEAASPQTAARWGLALTMLATGKPRTGTGGFYVTRERCRNLVASLEDQAPASLEALDAETSLWED
ncbi:MAG: PfkB family carbohydrate kinase [Firmicutes bacterium]|nr:PfkB family carbohydrate kinase [Bacillota bacterium]